MSFNGRPLRGFGMKCQFNRSSSSNLNGGLWFCSGVSEDRNLLAVSTIILAEWCGMRMRGGKLMQRHSGNSGKRRLSGRHAGILSHPWRAGVQQQGSPFQGDKTSASGVTHMSGIPRKLHFTFGKELNV